LSKVWILKLAGFDYSQKITIYAIGSFMTERGVFDDFFNSVNWAFELPNPKSSYLLTPLMIFLSRCFYFAPKLSHATFILAGFVIWANGLRGFVKNSIVIPLLFSYPILFAISRSNGIYISSALMLMSYSFAYGRNQNISLSVFLSALSVSFHPGSLMLAFALPFKSYVINWRIIAYTGLVNLGIIYYLSGGNVFDYFYIYSKSLSLYKIDYILGGGGSLFNNSIYGPIKLLIIYFSESKDGLYNSLIRFNDFYEKFLTLLAISTLFISIFYKNWIRKILLLTSVSLLFPQISADYKLEFIVIATSILIYAFENKLLSSNPQFYRLFTVFILIILPKHYVFYRVFDSLGEFFTLQSIINPLLLILAIYLIFNLKFTYPIDTKLRHED
jgi:hypothetical protein